VTFAFNLPGMLSNLPNTTPLTTAFPGTNMVRIFYNNPADMSFATLQNYVTALTNQGIVVELQDYTASFCVLTGTALTNSVNLMASYATAFKSNPYVWLATQNEPALYNLGATSCSNGSYNLAAITAEQLAYYNAIRATGNNNIVIISASGNPLDELFPSSVASQYAGMSNAVWDLHYYNWESGYATDVPSNAAKIAADETQHQVVTDTNGVIPVIIGEYGNSTDGNNVDPGWQATITAVNTTPDGEGSLGIGMLTERRIRSKTRLSMALL
jgi:Cellulase (glycosyl hydrolase family 5)